MTMNDSGSAAWLPYSYVAIAVLETIFAAYFAPGPCSKACAVAVVALLALRLAVEWRRAAKQVWNVKKL